MILTEAVWNRRNWKSDAHVGVVTRSAGDQQLKNIKTLTLQKEHTARQRSSDFRWARFCCQLTLSAWFPWTRKETDQDSAFLKWGVIEDAVIKQQLVLLAKSRTFYSMPGVDTTVTLLCNIPPPKEIAVGPAATWISAKTSVRQLTDGER